MYNAGVSEQQLGKSIAKLSPEKRSKVFIGSKIAPTNCAESKVEEHCLASLERLGIECLDLYIVHWPIPHT
jgi:diketogulonate reductase-like aldo/keto reductase